MQPLHYSLHPPYLQEYSQMFVLSFQFIQHADSVHVIAAVVCVQLQVISLYKFTNKNESIKSQRSL